PELAIWQTPPTADLIDRSDWKPADLRRRGTLFLCVDRQEFDHYACVLRVIVGQALAALRRDKAATPAATVTFFLDELARLGPMATGARPVDAAAGGAGGAGGEGGGGGGCGGGVRRAAVDVLRRQRRDAQALSERRGHDRELRGAMLRRAGRGGDARAHAAARLRQKPVRHRGAADGLRGGAERAGLRRQGHRPGAQPAACPPGAADRTEDGAAAGEVTEAASA